MLEEEWFVLLGVTFVGLLGLIVRFVGIRLQWVAEFVEDSFP